MRNPKLDSHQRQALLKKIQAKCKKGLVCGVCSNQNGLVKKIGAIKLMHEKYRGSVSKREEAAREFHEEFEEAIKHNQEIKLYLSKTQEDLNPLKVLKMFERISNEDCELIWLDPELGRPERLILTHILVPPVSIRPSVAMDSAMGSNEDDLTMKLAEILHVNNVIKDGIEKGNPIHVLMEEWEFLQLQCAMLVNSDIPNNPLQAQSSKPIRGLAQRLKGKTGRFRGNLSGKRVDFSGRTVISPDPNLRIDQVAVPELMAKNLTYPERVFQHNINKLRNLILNGADIHPGANFVQLSDGTKRYLKFGDRVKIAAELKIGDIVERHLADGDIVLFNRQPSLHRISIMCHKAKIMPWRTLRFNECVCTPYNADFDGDEMNLHVPQTEEARAEALTLMSVTHNLITPRTGEPIIAATQDFLTTAYIVSRKDTFYDRAQIALICSYAFDANVHIELPPPSILKPMQLWTGKQVFNMLIKPSRKSKILINVESKSKSYTSNLYMCPKDGYVCFQNSELLTGVIDKSSIGGGSKSNIFHLIMRDYSSDEAADCMTRLSKLSARWIGNHGFSIGISDVQPAPELRVQKEQLVQEGYDKCESYIKQFKEGKLQLQPGCNAEQTLEAKLNGELSEIRERAGKICLEQLHYLNSPLIMAVCGSKGSTINISQMIACVGQQTVNGNRIPNGFINRSLPHFETFSRSPAAKGFVQHSFYDGLSPTEFFFHTMGGREGLVDTAVKTAETGYMQRRLMKALEDLSTNYDSTVRNSSGGVVQFIYGDDELDPIGMEAKEKPVDIERALLHVKSVYTSRSDPPLFPADILAHLNTELDLPKYKEFSQRFKTGIIEFFTSYCASLIEKRKLFGIEITMETKFDPSNEEHLHFNTSNNLHRLTLNQLNAFLDICYEKYRKAKVEPGTAVGALAAQSIGEPGTQMTLKTFHFAGVASMNVTQGVPRIKEIINASKKISTPIITATLVCDNDIKAARIVKGRIEKTTLGEIVKHIKEVYKPTGSYLSIKLDKECISALQLEVTVSSIRLAILQEKKLKLKDKSVVSIGDDKIRVYPTDNTKDTPHYVLQHLKNSLPNVVAKGIIGVERAVINQVKDKQYNLLVEGNELLKVMATPGIKGTHTTSNHIMEVQKVLGIEVARLTIMTEIQTTMSHHGMTIDSRHVMLLADVMSYRVINSN